MDVLPSRSGPAAAVVIGRFPDQARVLLRKDPEQGFWTHFEGSGPGHRWEGVVQAFTRATGLAVQRLYAADYLEQYFDTATGQVMVIPVFVVETNCHAPVADDSQVRWCTLEEAIERVPFPNQVLLYEHVWRFFVDQQPTGLLEIALS